MDKRATIQIPDSLRKELKRLKRYERETYEEIIKKLMKKKEAQKNIKNIVKKNTVDIKGALK